MHMSECCESFRRRRSFDFQRHRSSSGEEEDAEDKSSEKGSDRRGSRFSSIAQTSARAELTGATTSLLGKHLRFTANREENNGKRRRHKRRHNRIWRLRSTDSTSTALSRCSFHTPSPKQTCKRSGACRAT